MQIFLTLNFFTYLKLLITGDTFTIEKLKELKHLYKTFKHSRYKFITKDKKITNLFLQKLFNLFTSVISYKPILDSTLFNKDEKRAQLYLNNFIETHFPEEIRLKREKFTKEIMLERIMESEFPTQTIKEIENEFIAYKKFINKDNLPKIESKYYLLLKLYQLSTFNFDLFFSKFQKDYVPPAQPVYSSVDGEDVLNDLKDLYFLIGSIPQKIDLTSAFSILYTLKKEDFKSQSKSMQHALNNLFKMVSDELSPQILITMCRFIAEDSKLRINIEQKYISILDKYRKEIDERFAKNKKFVLEKYSEKSLLQDVYSLFKGKHLLKFEGYTDELAKTLQDNNFEGISGIQAIKITKTFILEIYEPVIKEIVNSLILEAFFEEKDYQRDFSNIFFAANELKDYILGFEESLCGSGKNTFSHLVSFLKNFNSSNIINQNKIINLIDVLNQKIRHANEKCAESLFKLAAFVYKIIQDYKLEKPAYIINIRNIKGKLNKEFINSLANSYNDIAKYIKIIKNFIVDLDSKKSYI